MKEYQKEKQLYQILSKGIRNVMEKEKLEIKYLQEIRIRIGKPLIIIYKNLEFILPINTSKKYIVTKEDVREMLDFMSHYSLYAYESEIRRGYLTIEGGHRVGIAGKVVVEENRVKNIKYISSLNVRVAHEVIGCADKIFPCLLSREVIQHTLIISSPRCGKTTLIRDLIRQISDGNPYFSGCTVGVVDERSEFGGSYQGIPQNNLGMRTDLLDGCPKAEGMEMLIRSMSPSVLVIDELGGEEEIRALEHVMQSGCKILASVHARNLEEFFRKPGFEKIVKQRWFQRYIVLENEPEAGTVEGIYDEWGNPLCTS